VKELYHVIYLELILVPVLADFSPKATRNEFR